MPKKDKYLVAKDWPFVVVGCLVVKGKKALLVREAQVEIGKWNQPAGWLEKYEDPILGAKREAEEETGCKIKITRFLGIYSLDRRRVKGWHKTRLVNLHPIKFIFLAKIVGKSRPPDPKEITDVGWFNLEEIKNFHKRKLLRDPDIIDEVKDYLAGKGFSTKLIHHAKF